MSEYHEDDHHDRSISLWQSVQIDDGAPLSENISVDVCIVGAGIAGMSTAYMLAREGKSVAVLDDGAVGSGETGHTTAHLTNAIDDRFVEIERLHGEEGSRICAESHTAAIDTIDRIVQEEGIECDFERLDGYLFQGDAETDLPIEDELKAAHRAGLHDVELLPRVPGLSFDTGPSLRFPRQGEFHPLKYLAALARAIQRLGGHIYTGTHVEEFEGDERVTVRTSNGAVVTADAVVVATNSPINNLFAIHTKQAPYRTYAIGARVPRGTVPRGLYWDMLDPYHYIRLTRSPDGDDTHEIVIVGGEDRKVGDEEDTEERYRGLEEWARE
jgi:glycine/D-amino acid oxidase-like deaminating enzyme